MRSPHLTAMLRECLPSLLLPQSACPRRGYNLQSHWPAVKQNCEEKTLFDFNPSPWHEIQGCVFLIGSGLNQSWRCHQGRHPRTQRLTLESETKWTLHTRVWRIYSNIWIFEYIGHEYIFGHSFVSIFLLRIYSDIRSCQICLYEYIQTFVGECVRV